MNKYIITGNKSDECCDICLTIYIMYWRFLTNRGVIVKTFDPRQEAMRGSAGCGGGGMIVCDKNEICFATDFDLDIACGYHRVVRTSPFDLEGRRHTSFLLLSKWPIQEYPIGKTIMNLVLNPYVKMDWHLGGEKTLDILGDDVTKVLQGAIPWPETKQENEDP